MIDRTILARRVVAVRVASNQIEDLVRFCDTLADAANDGSEEP